MGEAQEYGQYGQNLGSEAARARIVLGPLAGSGGDALDCGLATKFGPIHCHPLLPAFNHSCGRPSVRSDYRCLAESQTPSTTQRLSDTPFERVKCEMVTSPNGCVRALARR